MGLRLSTQQIYLHAYLLSVIAKMLHDSSHSIGSMQILLKTVQESPDTSFCVLVIQHCGAEKEGLGTRLQLTYI